MRQWFDSDFLLVSKFHVWRCPCNPTLASCLDSSQSSRSINCYFKQLFHKNSVSSKVIYGWDHIFSGMFLYNWFTKEQHFVYFIILKGKLHLYLTQLHSKHYLIYCDTCFFKASSASISSICWLRAASLFHSIIQKGFIEHLVRATHCSGCWGSNEQNQDLTELCSHEERRDKEIFKNQIYVRGKPAKEKCTG